jgi:hypothetical protein
VIFIHRRFLAGTGMMLEELLIISSDYEMHLRIQECSCADQFVQ